MVYSDYAYIMVEPPSRIIASHKVKDEKEYNELLITAEKRKLRVYKAKVITNNGKYYVAQPWELINFSPVRPILIKESKTKIDTQTIKRDEPPIDTIAPKSKPSIVLNSNLHCPYCDKVLSSKPGRTLHIKSAHPDKIEEYMENKND